MDEGERLKDDLSQCGCDTCVMNKTSNSVQACSVLAHVAHVLVGVRRVTFVHIGHEDVVVVIYFCVAILFVICCIRRCTLYKHRAHSHLRGVLVALQLDHAESSSLRRNHVVHERTEVVLYVIRVVAVGESQPVAPP